MIRQALYKGEPVTVVRSFDGPPAEDYGPGRPLFRRANDRGVTYELRRGDGTTFEVDNPGSDLVLPTPPPAPRPRVLPSGMIDPWAEED